MAYNYLRNITLRSRRKKANKLNIVSNNALGITYFTPMNEPDEVIGDLVRVSSYNVPPLIPEYNIPEKVLNYSTIAVNVYKYIAEQCQLNKYGFCFETAKEIADKLNVSQRSVERVRKKLSIAGYLYYDYSRKENKTRTKPIFNEED